MVLINSKIITTLFALLCIYVSKVSYSQEIDVDDLLDRLERIERNISDIQKGKFDSLDKSLSSGYISRNEKRIDQIETNLRQNFGTLEEIQNQINLIGEKLDLINEDFQSRVLKLEKDLQVIKENKTTKKENKSSVDLSNLTGNDGNVQKSIITNPQKNLSEQEIKKKYENAIKLLWASKFEEAEVELVDLKKFNPEDLMPNIQYWLGEVHYAQKKFEKAILEFGEGLQKYPDSIKGPDNMLKLGLSFANLKKKSEACNVFYELEVKYKSAPKNVLERANSEKKKLDCPKE
jgi:tol-pal system protein YbgF|tara:strand:- start:648 stop:1520 length:873 start_codon:yes stop_codon:yes gene_type:complete